MSDQTKPMSMDALDEASLKLCNALALVDMIAAVDPAKIERDTMTSVGLQLWELIGDAKNLIDGKMEVPHEG